MKSSVKYFVLMMIVSVNHLSSQLLDSALAYYPMSVGNQWEYGYKLGPSTGYQYYFIVTIESDTLLSNGKVYKKKIQRKLPDGPVNSFFERVDSSTGYVYTVDLTSLNESLSVMLRANLHDAGGSYGTLNLVSLVTILGVPTFIKDYSPCIGCLGHTLAYGFGLTGTYEVLGDAWPAITELKYAKINGHEYGTFLSVDKTDLVRPYIFQLQQNYPNPFNPTTCISFTLPKQEDVLIQVFDVLGRKTTILVDGITEAGLHSITFDGSELSSGVYIIRMIAGENASAKAILLQK
jgi:hypothetical protein